MKFLATAVVSIKLFMLLARKSYFSSNKSVNNAVESSFQSLLELDGAGGAVWGTMNKGNEELAPIIIWDRKPGSWDGSMVRKTEENVIQRKNWETKCLYCVQCENGYAMQAGEHTGARRWTVNLYCVQWENSYGMQQACEHPEHEVERWTCIVCSEKMAMECRQVSKLEHEGERWNCVLCAVRKWLWNAGRWALWSTKLNDETRRLGQSSKRSAAVRGQADRRDFLPARFCGRSRADLLLERQSAALLPSCARPVYCCTKIIKPPNQNHCCFLFSEKVGISCWWRLIIGLEILRQEAFFKKTKSSSSSSYPKFGIFFFFFFISHWIFFLLVSRMNVYQKTPHWERFLSAGFFGDLWRGGRGRGGAGLCFSCLFFFPLVTHLLVL